MYTISVTIYTKDKLLLLKIFLIKLISYNISVYTIQFNQNCIQYFKLNKNTPVT